MAGRFRTGRPTPIPRATGSGFMRSSGSDAGRRRRKRQGDGFGIKKDFKTAQGLIDEYGLNAPLGRVDATRAPETAALIGNAQGLFDKYSQRDADQAALLARLQAEQGGMTNVESTAFREEAESGLESQLATAMRALGMDNAARGVMGGAAQAGALDLYGQRAAAQRGVERDLIAQNLALKEARTDRLGGYLNQLINDEAARGRGALADLTGITTGAQADELAKNIFNINQGEKELGIKTSNLLGLAGAAGNRRMTKQALRAARARDERAAANDRAYTDAISKSAAAYGGTGI